MSSTAPTQNRSQALLHHHLKALKLPTMLRECEKMAALCAKENADHPAFLLRLAEAELLEREQKSTQRRIKEARFPSPKTLEDFDFAAQPSVNKALVSEMMRGVFIASHENVLLMGSPGTGKTHLATALGMAACGLGKRVRFFRTTELITQLMEARDDRQLTRLRGQLARLDVLILDEFGYVPASKLGAELFFDVIAQAYERSSIVLTTNMPFERWTEILGCERLTGAVLDRITHRCHIIEASGSSYRLDQAKRRRAGRPADHPAGKGKPS